MSESSVRRKLTAILYADIAGYSRLTGQDELGTHKQVMAVLDYASETIRARNGQVLRYAGDAILAEFDSVVGATQTAVEIQQELSAQNNDKDDEDKVQIRIGLNLGEVIEDRGEIYGDGVNLAARLEAAAPPGGICLSASVNDQIKRKVDIELVDGDEEIFKNIDAPVRVYRWHPNGLDVIQSLGVQPTNLAPALPDKPSIAVLPFDNMSNDPEQEYFSDGIVEDIITALSYFSGLFVIARNSSFSYKGQSIDARKVAEELGVRYLLEGSVRRSGNRIRITGQLINALDGSHLWAEKFDGDLDDIFELQDDITRKIVGSIAPQIVQAELERGQIRQSTNMSSYDLALLAKRQTYDAFRRGEPGALQTAFDTAKHALALDARNTHALSILVMAYIDQYIYQWGEDPLVALDHALEGAEKLIQINASDADGFISRANCNVCRGDFELAMADYGYGLTLNPNSALHNFYAAWGESLAGLTTQAKEHAQLGLRLSPKEMDLFLGVAYLSLLQASFAESNFDEAIQWGRLSIQMHGKAPIRRALMVASCAYTGELEEARRHAVALEEFSPSFIPSLLNGEMGFYKSEEHNALVVDGLRQSGLFD